MIVPIIVYIIGIIAMGYIHVLLDPAVQAMFEASTNEGVEMALLTTGWEYVTILYAIVGGIVMVILAQKRGGGTPF